MTDPYENLVNAIVLQAVKDYRDALKRLKKKPSNQAALSDTMEPYSVQGGQRHENDKVRVPVV